jgi:hypothetical protein
MKFAATALFSGLALAADSKTWFLYSLPNDLLEVGSSLDSLTSVAGSAFSAGTSIGGSVGSDITSAGGDVTSVAGDATSLGGNVFETVTCMCPLVL